MTLDQLLQLAGTTKNLISAIKEDPWDPTLRETLSQLSAPLDYRGVTPDIALSGANKRYSLVNSALMQYILQNQEELNTKIDALSGSELQGLLMSVGMTKTIQDSQDEDVKEILQYAGLSEMISDEKKINADVLLAVAPSFGVNKAEAEYYSAGVPLRFKQLMVDFIKIVLPKRLEYSKDKIKKYISTAAEAYAPQEPQATTTATAAEAYAPQPQPQAATATS